MKRNGITLNAYELAFEKDDFYHEVVILSETLAAAILIAYNLTCERDTNITVSAKQPIMVDAKGRPLDGCFEGGATFGPLYEATFIGTKPTIEEIEEHLNWRYTHPGVGTDFQHDPTFQTV